MIHKCNMNRWSSVFCIRLLSCARSQHHPVTAIGRMPGIRVRTAGKATHRTHTTFGSGRSLVDYAKNRYLCRNFCGGFDAFRYNLGRDSKYTSANAQFALGSARVSADGKAMLYEEGTWNPQLQLEAEAQAALAQLKAGF